MTHLTYTVKNRLHIAADSGAAPADFVQALKAELDAFNSKVEQVDPQTLQFDTPWEPPMKVLRQLSKQFPELELTVYGDAFTVQHWIYKSTLANGKVVNEETVTRNDGERFDAIFTELYNEPYHLWEQRQE